VAGGSGGAFEKVGGGGVPCIRIDHPSDGIWMVAGMYAPDGSITEAQLVLARSLMVTCRDARLDAG
jgi:hypothetical protein